MSEVNSSTAPSIGATVIVPSRGGRSHLPALIKALGGQDTDDFEVVVVLDGDIDSSAEYLKTAGEDYTFALRTIVFPENRGRVAALNAGAAAAGGRVLIRCDDDLVPAPHFVATHLSHHNGPAAGVIGLCRNVYPDTPYARIYGQPTDQNFRRGALATAEDARWNYWGGNVSIPRSMHQQLNGYDARYRTYGWEDVDFGYRLHLHGVPVRIDGALTTDHLVAATTTPIRALRALHSGAARETFLQIHGRDNFPTPLPSGPWGLLVKNLGRILNERSIKILGGAVDGVAAFIPPYVSKKLMALLIESSAHAGNVHPGRARRNF